MKWGRGRTKVSTARLRARLEKDRPAKSLEDGPDQGYEALNEMTLQGVKA